MIHIIYVADTHKHFEDAYKEYVKRLGSSVRFHVIRPVKTGPVSMIVQKETLAIAEVLKKIEGHPILLSVEGKMHTSHTFVEALQKWSQEAKNTIFIIGGAYGMNELFIEKERACSKFSLSSMTLPHSLALVVLLEQLYRAQTLVQGGGYDK